MPAQFTGAAISAREFDVSSRRQLCVRTIPIPKGSTISVGREADLLIGTNPHDAGVSRLALTVSRTDGWRLDVRNRNGVVVQPWAQGATWVEARSELELSWARVGVRLVGSERSVEHWVLLESAEDLARRDDSAPLRPGPPRPRLAENADPAIESGPGFAGATRRPNVPRPLTRTQEAAVRTVFREFLAWPPISGAAPVPIAAAANRLGVSTTAVHERLTRVRERAYALGLHQQIGVSDPNYVHLLVRHGYLKPTGKQ
jgi:hypothetical protein